MKLPEYEHLGRLMAHAYMGELEDVMEQVDKATKGKGMTPHRRAAMKRWTKDQLIDQTESDSAKIGELNELLEARDGTVHRLNMELGKVQAELREARSKYDFYERLLKKLVGVL
jgi:hypothetical protein